MTLLELLQAVKEERLTKMELEDLHTKFTNLYGEMQMEMAFLEKAEAMYFLENKVTLNTDKGPKDRSDVEIKRMWRGTLEGQRLIELDRWAKACEKQLSSLKNRIYSLL